MGEQFGHVDEREPNRAAINRRRLLSMAVLSIPGLAGAEEVQTDLVVYGATPGGICAAIAGRRQGLSVRLVGGWRERHLGGMLSGGLGHTDCKDFSAIGGLAREFLDNIRAARPRSAEVGLAQPYNFLPSEAERVFARMVDAAGLEVEWSDGVSGVRKSSSKITALTTADGRTFRGRAFVDASYEGDLLAAAGVSYTIGRGQADDANPTDGFRGRSTEKSNLGFQFNSRGAPLLLDPFNRPGDPASGLLPHVEAFPGRAVGARDGGVPAYNFRLSVTPRASDASPIAAVEPPGFDPREYELLFRYLEAKSALGDPVTFDELFTLQKIGPDIFDLNSRGPFSTDAVGLSQGYPGAAYRVREQLWKAHERYMRGLFYAIGGYPEPRVSDVTRASAREWGLAKGEFLAPRAGDAPNWPYQLYVREARRLQGVLQWNAADLDRIDGWPARSGRIVALATYPQDSHVVSRLAYRQGARWGVWVEGGFLQRTGGGADHRSPIPLEIMLPKPRECSNLAVTFCVSASHPAFSAIRMELTSMAMGEAAGRVAALYCRSGAPSFLDVPFGSLQTTLKRNGSVLEERMPPRWAERLGGAGALVAVAGAAGFIVGRRTGAPAPKAPG